MAASAATAAPEHKEPDSELARGRAYPKRAARSSVARSSWTAERRDLVLKMQYEPARKALEPKVLDGKASREETRTLETICEKQGDRMYVALCDAKLK